MSVEASSLIYLLNDTLRKMISKFLKIDETEINLDSPGDLDHTPDKGLSLFLYRIMENSSLRNQDVVPEAFVNPVRLRNAPLALDLFYLIIPFGDSESRLILLEKVMQLFHDFPILDSSLLPAGLINTGNREVKILFNDYSIEDANKLWSLFPNKPYRLSLSYLITPLIIPSSRISERAISRVITKDSFISDKD